MTTQLKMHSSLSVLTDAEVILDSLNTSLFPGVSSDVQVHDGFQDQHALTASKILAEVKRLMSAHGTNSVTCVSNSLATSSNDVTRRT